jgi:hypothetical protein
MPLASVTAEAGFREAPATVVDHVTVLPEDAAPSSVTTTRSGAAKGCPTLPL